MVHTGKEDTSRDNKLTSEADTDDDTLQRQCCKPNCFSIMTGKKLLCGTDTIMRGDVFYESYVGARVAV